MPSWSAFACYMLLLTGAGLLWMLGQHHSPLRAAAQAPGHFRAILAQANAGLDAALNAIEPASGAAPAPASPPPPADHGTPAEGDHEPKKSMVGKVLSAEPTMPSITIGLLKVETRKDLKLEAEMAFTPADLRQPEQREMLKRRFHFKPYAHDAVRGNIGGAITLVEFSDLSCLQCMDDLKKADELFAAQSGNIRYIQVYLPVDTTHKTNLAAFYGKVAQRGGKFWEFRQALFNLKEPSAEAYFNALVQVGVPAADARRWLTTEARRFYRELDADAQLSRALGLDRPPHFFVNGIHVGDGGLPRASLSSVLLYETNYTHYQLDSLSHD